MLLLACSWPPRAAPDAARLHELPAPDPAGERSCAWFGDVQGGVLHFGVAAFWSALRGANGDASADLRAPGPRWIGRFDLAREAFLPPLAAGVEPAPTGVWDVLAHPNGRLYYTTYFGAAGSVDLATGSVVEFTGAGLGLNELALGPDGTVLVTRYGYGEARRGSVVVLGADGALLAEHPLAEPPGHRVAAKSIAFDPLAREIWVNTDLLPVSGAGAALHDTRVLALDGREKRRISEPELQFFTFRADGTGYLAEVTGARLALRVVRPDGARGESLVPLDDAFDAAHDFVQEVRAEPSGHAVVTRWSGHVHVLAPDGRVQNLLLPRSEQGELYYTGTLADGRLCATRCGGVEVVCRDLGSRP